MQIEPCEIADVKLITPKFWRDDRGFFVETFRIDRLAEAGVDVTFVQDNHSMSTTPGTIRGLHFQTAPHPQAKLVRCVRGAILDVAVDLRRASPTYGRHVAVKLSADDGRQLYVPVGFAHGFCTLEPNSEVIYKVSDYYAPACDKGVAWDDPDLAIEWPVAAADAVLSAKDTKQPRLSDLPALF